MSRLGFIALCALALVACDKKKESGGLPPAKDWHKAGTAEGSAGEAAAGGGANFHGTPSGADPHAGVDMSGGAGGAQAPHGQDPHAGMDPNHGAGGGMGAGGMAGAAPDPSRPIDPNHYVRGTIKVAPAVKAKVKAGGALFLSAKRPDPKTGEGVGMPLAVQKLALDPNGMKFDLSEENAMMMGTEPLSGDVVVTARYDQDGDAMSKQSGDVVGKVRAKVPAKDLVITLDTLTP